MRCQGIALSPRTRPAISNAFPQGMNSDMSRGMQGVRAGLRHHPTALNWRSLGQTFTADLKRPFNYRLRLESQAEESRFRNINVLQI